MYRTVGTVGTVGKRTKCTLLSVPTVPTVPYQENQTYQPYVPDMFGSYLRPLPPILNLANEKCKLHIVGSPPKKLG